MSQKIASRYKILHELGHGMMGTVYLVEHLDTGGQLALKVLRYFAGADPDAIERFKREARAAASVNSEHVVRITDAGTAPELGGAPFLVMEVLQGADLEKTLEMRGRLPPAEVAALLSQLGRALDKAHALGIVHRDLKPANLFLHTREDGSTILKILDFGVSKSPCAAPIAPGQNPTALTSTGMPIGTPRYMPPEQARGQSSAMGPSADMWAVGMIAFRLLSGEDYWVAETVADLIAAILTGPMPPPSQRAPALGRAFDVWFAKSCERDPGKRWSSAGEQATALCAVLLGTPAFPANLQRTHRPARVAGLVGAAILLAAALAAAAVLRIRRTPAQDISIATAEPHATERLPPSAMAPAVATSVATTSTATAPLPNATASAAASSSATDAPPASATAKPGRPTRPATTYNPAYP